jgi:hypothetical protein
MSDDPEVGDSEEPVCILVPYFVDDEDRSWADDLEFSENIK